MVSEKKNQFKIKEQPVDNMKPSNLTLYKIDNWVSHGGNGWKAIEIRSPQVL